MTSRKIPESAVENLVSDLEGKANVATTVTTNTTQTITASKNLKTGGTVAYSRPLLWHLMVQVNVMKEVYHTIVQMTVRRIQD